VIAPPYRLDGRRLPVRRNLQPLGQDVPDALVAQGVVR